MAKHLKVMSISVDGLLLKVDEDSSEFDPGGIDRPPVKANGGVVGYVESGLEAMCKGDILPDANFSIEDTRGWVNVTVTVQCDTGQLFVMKDAWLRRPVVLRGGKASFELVSTPAEEA